MDVCTYCNNPALIRRFGKYLCEYHNSAYISGEFVIEAANQKTNYEFIPVLPTILVNDDGSVVVDWN
jgi:hypothetical protein